MRPARRGGVAVGASARALLVVVVLLVVVIGRRGAEAIRVVPHWSAPGGKARNWSRGHSDSHGGGGGGRVAVLPRKAMPLVGTRPVPVRLQAGSAEEESKRRIPSCPDPLHNR